MRQRSVNRYETMIATMVGVSALFVSGYTAYVQRQQVRAAVWPILEYNTSNDPNIRLTLDNKGVGPAIIRNVIVKVDDQPLRTWHEVMQKLLGPGTHRFSESTMSNHVLSASESMNILIPMDNESKPLIYLNSPDPLSEEMNKARLRVAVEVCYCSTLGECWILRAGPNESSTTETRTCPASSATTFQ